MDGFDKSECVTRRFRALVREVGGAKPVTTIPSGQDFRYAIAHFDQIFIHMGLAKQCEGHHILRHERDLALAAVRPPEKDPMFQIVRQRGRYDVRLDNSPMFARYDDADAWVSEFVKANQGYSRTGPEALSVGAIVPEGRTPDDPCF